MSFIVRRPVQDLPSIDRVLGSFFEEPFFGLPAAIAQADEGLLGVDVSEDEKNVIVRASLPGFSKDEIDVEVHEGVLSIKASHAQEKESSGERYYRKERRTGALSRRIALPGSVAEGQTQAELRDGVLTLRLPKAVKDQPRKVKIS